MSAFYGILKIDGSPVSAQTLQPMKTALSGWREDTSGEWCKDSIGLGQLTVFNTPESFQENGPYCSEISGCVIAANARIDNRKELIDILQTPHDLTDPLLILKSYEKWGQDCPDKLLGDFSFAIWDPNKHHLFLCVDHFQNKTIFYSVSNHHIIFSSAPKPILSFPGIHLTLNEYKIALNLTDHPHALPDQTLFSQISRLPSAHSMTITKQGDKTCRLYWSLKNSLSPIHYKKNSDYIDHFKEIFSEAVSCRLRSAFPPPTVVTDGDDWPPPVILGQETIRDK